MKNPALKRQLCAWLLLAVFLPVLTLSSVHVHQHTHAQEVECNDCLNHCCPGHLTVLDHSFHQCVFCQFLTLSYIGATTIAVILFAAPYQKPSIILHAAVRIRTCGIPLLRAPPVSVLN